MRRAPSLLVACSFLHGVGFAENQRIEKSANTILDRISLILNTTSPEKWENAACSSAYSKSVFPEASPVNRSLLGYQGYVEAPVVNSSDRLSFLFVGCRKIDQRYHQALFLLRFPYGDDPTLSFEHVQPLLSSLGVFRNVSGVPVDLGSMPNTSLYGRTMWELGPISPGVHADLVITGSSLYGRLGRLVEIRLIFRSTK